MSTVPAIPLREAFERNIDREIDAVVKADSDRQLAVELDEFVMTAGPNGMARPLEDLLAAYTDPDSTVNGAWISGFYGSGKSHLLKVLARILESASVEGRPALDHIRPALKGMPELEGAFERAIELHPSESVLFNINNLATGTDSTEATLAGFINAFNKHRGYFTGSQAFIASMEATLDSMGAYGRFKELIQEKTGLPWEQVRPQAILRKKAVTEAMDEALGNPPGTSADALTLYKDSYAPSIDSFVQDVAAYVRARQAEQPGFRLNFYVDEVGQFIAKRAEAMIALQSIVEGLNTAVPGGSWVFVTSQEDIKGTTEKFQDQAAYDFSKIQARFGAKVPLVAEASKTIIERRLLEKTAPAADALELMYEDHADDFGMLFQFEKGTTPGWDPYQSLGDFQSAYPFVPYQFDLFIQAFRALSEKDLFTGRDHSTAARNMLGVFQDIAKSLAVQGSTLAEEPLAAFDLTFDRLRPSMRQEEIGQLNSAAELLGEDSFALRVLKALFLVKHLDNFHATPANLRVLLYGSFQEDTTELEDRVADALALLDQKKFARRDTEHGAYVYLTNEERDIEREIENTSIATQEAQATVAKLYDEVAHPHRVSWKRGSVTCQYRYTLKVDDWVERGQPQELAVRVVTEAPDGIASGEKLTLTITLRNAGSFLRDLDRYLKTKAYVQTHGAEDGMRKYIIELKHTENFRLYDKLRNQFAELLGQATFRSEETDITRQLSGSGKAIVDAGVLDLASRVYTQLPEFPTPLDDKTIANHVFHPQLTLDGQVPEHAALVLRRLKLSERELAVAGDESGALMGAFTKKPYGWPSEAVRDAVAILAGTGDIEARTAAGPLSAEELAGLLNKPKSLPQVRVQRVERMTEDETAQLREAFNVAFGMTPNGADLPAIATSVVAQLKEAVDSYGKRPPEPKTYPFAGPYRDRVSQLRTALHGAQADPKHWTRTQLSAQAESIREARNDLEAMSSLLEGQKAGGAYKLVRDYRATGLNEARLLGIAEGCTPELEERLRRLTEDPNVYKTGLGGIKSTLRQLLVQILAAKEQERAAQQAALAAYREQIQEDPLWKDATEKGRADVEKLFADAAAQLKDTQNVYRLQEFVASFKRDQQGRIVKLLTPALEPAVNKGGQTPPPPPPPPTTVTLSQLARSAGGPAFIKTQDEVDAFIDQLRAKLLAEVDAGHVVMR